MSKQLHIARGFRLPDEAVTQTFAILAKRGVGKTYTAAVMVEEMVKAGLPVVVADPIGVWWGLRSSADGKRKGLPVTILGGEHGDIPLEPGAGEVIADTLVDNPFPAVLDLGQFRKGEQIRFMTAFAERLYHRNRSALHLVLDEADAFAPQRTMKGQGAERLLGAIEDLVRRGRARGLGVTLITQRPAVLNKNVLTQIEVLVALRTISPQDRKAIDEWVNVHGEEAKRTELQESIASLAIGEAYFWSPGWLDVFKRVQVRERETFDSSATPKAGERKIEPRAFADVDLDAIQQAMAATVEKAKADDPRELRKTIAQLRRELEQARADAPDPETREVEVPVFPEPLRNAIVELLDGVAKSARGLIESAEHHKEWLDNNFDLAIEIQTAPPLPKPRVDHGSRAPAQRSAPPKPRPAPRVDHGSNGDGPHVSGPQQRILDSLAALEVIGVTQPAKTQVALFAQASPKSSAYTNNLGALRTAGLIEYPVKGTVALTADGRGRADASSAPSTDDELHEFVRSLVGPTKWRILEVLIAAYPEAIAKTDLADAAGASATSSAYTNNLGSLRSLKLIDYPEGGYVAALPALFMGAAA